MTKDNIKSIIGLLKNELQSIQAAINRHEKDMQATITRYEKNKQAAINRHENEISGLEASKRRINNIIDGLEGGVGECRTPPIKETIDFFIEDRCVIDPGTWEDYNRLYDDFEHFKAEEGITTKILKRAFFAELASRGHFKHPGPGLYEGEPTNSINGLYLRSRRPEIDKLKEDRARQAEKFWEYQAGLQAEQREEEDRLFNKILDQTEEEEEEDSEPAENKRGLFDFK